MANTPFRIIFINLWAVVCTILAPSISFGDGPPHSDIRVPSELLESKIFDARKKEVDITSSIAGAQVSADTETGLITRIRGRVPTGDDSTPRAAAEHFLREHASAFGLNPELSELSLIRETTGLGAQVIYHQQYQGLEVFRGRVIVALSRQNHIMSVSSSVIPIPFRDTIEKPADPAKAIQEALRVLNANDFKNPEAFAEPFVAVKDGHPIAIWKVGFKHRRIPWSVLVDAKTNVAVQAYRERFYAE